MIEESERIKLHVVIGVIKNSNNEVLISQRKLDSHLGGLLEFPGGKVKSGEKVSSALKRELKEELDISVIKSTPLIQIPYEYSGKSVFLDVYYVEEYKGVISPNESQRLFWQKLDELDFKAFPYANHGVLRAMQLPRLLAITPNFSDCSKKFLYCFESVLKNISIPMVILRSHELNKEQFLGLAKKCFKITKELNKKLILNQDTSFFSNNIGSGIHLTSKRLLACNKRPVRMGNLVGASCHNLNEIQHASKLKLDYVLLGHILEKDNCTKDAISWSGFEELVKNSQIPVYAIGGLDASDVKTSIKYGGQGIAAIRGFWDQS